MNAANAAIAANLADNTIYGNDYNSIPAPFWESKGFFKIPEVSPLVIPPDRRRLVTSTEPRRGSFRRASKRR